MRRHATIVRFTVVILAFSCTAALAPIYAQPSVERVPTSAYESLPNTISNVLLYHTNYGVLGHNVAGNTAGGFWPRGSTKAYVYGGGLWIGAQKRVDGQLKPLSVIGYNPNSGGSWFTPGIAPGVFESPNMFRLYRSTEYDIGLGIPLDSVDRNAGGANWPIWHLGGWGTVGLDGYVGNFLYDTSARRQSISGAPLFASSEDIAAIYHDNDLTRYEGQDGDGHPLGVQVEQVSYSWSVGPFSDVVIVRYRIINVSPDTLFDACIGLALDLDIGNARNDRSKIAIASAIDDTLDLAVAWSDREATGRYGYVGLDLLESPERDDDGFARGRDGLVGVYDEVGLRTFQSWSIEEDPATSADRYAFMASGDRDTHATAHDDRALLATGTFHMRPGDTATASFALIFAMGPGAGDPTGTWADMAPLLELDRRLQTYHAAAFQRAQGFTTAVPSAPAMPSRSGSLGISPSPVGHAMSSSRAHVSFTLDESSQATVRLVDAHGRVVRSEDLGLVRRGDHRVSVETGSLPSGLYVVVIDAGATSLRGRLIVQH